MLDLNGLIGVATMQEPASITADTYSDYVDTNGYEGVAFHISFKGGTADATNYITPSIYGYTGSAPGTASGYTVLGTADYNGTIEVADDTDDHAFIISLRAHEYRYYHILWDETSTATVVVQASALLVGGDHPAGDDSITTGAVS